MRRRYRARHSHRLIGVLVVAIAFYAWRHPWLTYKIEDVLAGSPPAGAISPATAAPTDNVAALPNPALTPGALNPRVTQQDIYSTICRRGWTRTIRPPEEYTEALKRLQIREYGYRDRRLGAYEEDHLISLELGGSPTAKTNLWPQPHHVAGGWGSFAKDRLENVLNHLVCSRRLSLAAAQQMISTNWIAAYKRYVGSTPDNRPTY